MCKGEFVISEITGSHGEHFSKEGSLVLYLQQCGIISPVLFLYERLNFNKLGLTQCNRTCTVPRLTKQRLCREKPSCSDVSTLTCTQCTGGGGRGNFVVTMSIVITTQISKHATVLCHSLTLRWKDNTRLKSQLFIQLNRDAL